MVPILKLPNWEWVYWSKFFVQEFIKIKEKSQCLHMCVYAQNRVADKDSKNNSDI